MENLIKETLSFGNAKDATTQAKKCQDKMQYSFNRCPTVKFIHEAIEKMGCPTDAIRMKCMDCEGQINGGFQVEENGKPAVVLCQNHLVDQDQVNRTIAHELLHAYDYCRAKVNLNNCYHHACTEVRAAALSGDCSYGLEFRRGHRNPVKQHQECVKRRAELSLASNEACKGKEKEFVDAVFETCYKDTFPFERMP